MVNLVLMINQKKKILINTLFVVLSFTFVSCFDLFEPTYWESGDYVIWNSPGTPSCKTLYYDIDGAGRGRVSCVLKIGENDEFIIVESDNGKKEFWILEKKKDNSFLNAEEIMLGPYNQKEFLKAKKELGINHIGFTDYFN